MLRILYLLMGPSAALQTQCEYAVLSALAFAPAACQIHVFTDAPAALDATSERVTCEPLPPTAAGADPFAVKLAVLAAAATRFPEDDLLFADADTFFTRDFTPLKDLLSQGDCLLHRPEYAVLSEPGPQMRKFRRALRRAAWPLADGDLMWNSGVIGIPTGQATRIREARKSMAQLLPFVDHRRYLAEQFAVSSALADATRADAYVFHYWYQKQEYTSALHAVLAEWSGLPVAGRIESMQKAGVVRLVPPERKLHWWERLLIAAGIRDAPSDPRGLPGL